MKRIIRREYLDKLKKLKEKHVIKIVTGVRRCGKSTLLEIFRDFLLSEGVEEERIVFINFEDYDNYELRDPHLLHSFLKERISSDGFTYIFLDEIQRVDDFHEVVDSLFINEKVDLYLTGSNAHMLSGEIATLISGRYIEISMLPLSFAEFVEATDSAGNLSSAYAQYINAGSLPYAVEMMDSPAELTDYLNGVYNTIVLKDVMMRMNISDPMMLESVIRFVFDNIGNLLSTSKISDTMTSSGRKTDVKTVEKYISGLVDSFIIYRAKRYNIKGKQYLKTLDKYYVVDTGIRRMLLGNRSMDVGHILENVVYLELLRRGYDVYVGKIDDLEVDFVAMDERDILYCQVAATVRDEGTLARELAPLKKIPDQYRKLLLTLDDDPEADYSGIRRVNALEWLLGR